MRGPDVTVPEGRAGLSARLASSPVAETIFVVEVSNPRFASDDAYERWEVDSLTALADRIESETGWARTECDEVARAVDKGNHFEDEDIETGRTVTARRVERVEA